jgi:hypothetical protein
MTSSCASIRHHLGAYADGELKGADRHRLSGHLAACRACSETLEEIRAIGELLRAEAGAPVRPELFAGLAAGVVSRTRAEEAQSWRAVFRRATGDWHYALTGGGALAAGVASILFLAAICQIGPQREGESLARVLETIEQPAGKLWIYASPIGPNQAPMVMQVTDETTMFATPRDLETLPSGFFGPSEGDLAVALSNVVVRADGRVRDWRSMPQSVRMDTEAQLYKIKLAQWAQRQPPVRLSERSAQALTIERIAFTTMTRVTGKSS